MARKDRHTFRVGRSDDPDGFLGVGSQEHGPVKTKSVIHSNPTKRRATSIFPQPFGVGIGTWSESLEIRGVPLEDRLICEGFDPGSE
jgi:hypothetical protein